MIVVPCKECEGRHNLCHSTCEKYLEYKRLNDLEKKRDYDSRMIDAAISTSNHHRAVTRRIKR